MQTRIEMPVKQQERAEALVAETHRRGGLAPVDVERFWADQEIAQEDPFGAHIPQVPIGALVSRECIFAELDIPEDWHRLWHDPQWGAEISKAYNDKAWNIVGKRPLHEGTPEPNRQYPQFKALHDLFEARNVWHDQSYWLMKSAHSEDQLKALLDRVEQRLAENLQTYIFPENWDEEKTRLTALGVMPPLYFHQRGPVTFATSVYGSEELIFLYYDNPDLFVRFSQTILKAMIALKDLLNEEAGFTLQTAPRGFSFLDDNCCLLNPEMYEMFGAPILKGIWDRYAPNPGDRRYQHSDSAMGHLLPQLGKLNLTATNFGPTVLPDQIRAHLPKAVIEGELAPFTYSRNEEVNIVAEFLRDHAMTREERGLRFTTAGSVNNGSRLTGMRLIMAAVQRYGRYG